MSKDKISDYSATANSNTDIGGINIDEGCAPSGINDAIRTLMKQLKDFQQGTNSDSFNGPVGSVTPAAGAFTTLSASSTLSVTGAGTIQGLTVGKGAGAVSTNTAVGASALAANTSGPRNTAVGYTAMYLNQTGQYNSAYGYQALYSTTGSNNTAMGHGVMFSNTSGASNSALGNVALVSNTTGSYNVAIGESSLQANTTASNNTAVGYQAGYSNVTGNSNTFFGYKSGYASANSGGIFNAFFGDNSGVGTTTGYANTFVGSGYGGGAGSAVTTGNKNTILGAYSGNQGGLDIRTSSNNVVLSDGDGNPRYLFSGSGNYTLLGGVSSADTALVYSYGTYNYTSGAAANMGINSSGFMYRSTSSLKYKQNVQNATHGLAAVMQLRPVTYESKQESESGVVYGGLIAEEVHAAGLTEFVQYAEDGTPDALAYGNMVSLAFKAIQELKAEFDAYKEAHP